MDIISVYQTVYIVLFILAGVFFILSVVFFFLFDIRTVVNNLYGRNTNGARPIKRQKKRKGKAGSGAVAVAPSAASKSPNYGGTVIEDSEATVMTRFLETMMIDPDEDTPASPAPAAALKREPAKAPALVDPPFSQQSTEQLDDYAREVNATLDSVKRKIGFRPDVKILVYSAGDRII